eukprot:8792256-Pyramimonas_sp.AAC.1
MSDYILEGSNYQLLRRLRPALWVHPTRQPCPNYVRLSFLVMEKLVSEPKQSVTDGTGEEEERKEGGLDA